MKLISWNVNGLRAVAKKGFLDWFAKAEADAVCVQEIKAFPEQVEEAVRHPMGYASYWAPAKKPGYSGVAIFTKREPLEVEIGLGDDSFDLEGRVLSLHYPEYVLINAYFPNSQREGARLGYKLDFCKAMLAHCESLRKNGKNLVLCGDYNIAHNPIDLKNPKSNEKNAGYLPEERAWMDAFTKKGYVDVFRKFEKGPDHYTWWSYRPGIRERNVGWRIDYFCANPEFEDRLRPVTHHTKILGSDHCPIELNLRN